MHNFFKGLYKNDAINQLFIPFIITIKMQKLNIIILFFNVKKKYLYNIKYEIIRFERKFISFLL